MLDDENDGVGLTIEVPEDDLDQPLPLVEEEDLEVRPQPEKQQAKPVRQPQARQEGTGADVLRAQLARSSGLIDSLQGANQRAQTELVRQRQENAELQANSIEERRALFEQSIQTLDASLDEAEAAYAKAFDSGDGAAAAKAQRRISELTASKYSHQTQLSQLPTTEQLAERVKAAAAPRTREERVEQYISQFTPKSQEWLRGHEDFITDRIKNQRLLLTHKRAIDKGLESDTEEYFDFLNQQLGLSEPNEDHRPRSNGHDRETQREPQPMKRSSTPVRSSVPVRGGSGISVQKMRSVKLTDGELENATNGTIIWNYDDPTGKNRFKKGDPIGVNEMARRKAGIKAGKAGGLRYMSDDE